MRHEQRARLRPRRRPFRQLAALCGLLLVGCADDGNASDPNALPRPAESTFGEADFDDIPVFRGATPIQPASEEEGAVVASYETQAGSPEQALRFYEENLPDLGWQIADPVRETSEDVWRGDWVRDGRRLQISALPLTVDDDPVVHTQFSLVLLDDAGDIPVGGTQPPASDVG